VSAPDEPHRDEDLPPHERLAVTRALVAELQANETATLAELTRALREVAELRGERQALAAELERMRWDLVEARMDLQAAVERGRDGGRRRRPDAGALRLPDWTEPTVVVPVYGALEAAQRCIRSVLERTEGDYRLLVVDDASPDPAIRPALADLLAGHEHAHLHEHLVNRGYTATINEACRAVAGDVVLLNSDTEVAAGWLDGLRTVAASRRDVATVTPVSNAAGAFSVPETNVDWQLPPGLDVTAVAALVQRISPRRRPEVPTGNGFCLYITRRALDAVGDFDEEAFPRGYGEENDFCMRALQAGFLHLIDDATFVYHERSASFGPAKRQLIEESKAQLALLHPSYKRRVTTMLAEDPLAELRARLKRALSEREEAAPERPTVLFVIHNGGGGIPQTNADLMRAVAGEFRPVLLRADIGGWELIDPQLDEVLRAWRFSDSWDATAPLGEERRAALDDACELVAPALVHVRSLVAAAPDLVPQLKDRGLPVVVSLHDFYTVCPTIQLLDQDTVYCAGHCTPGPGACPTAGKWFRGELPVLKHAYVHEWRERMAEGLRHADRFVTTSQAAADVLVDHFPFIAEDLRVIEHGRDWDGAVDVAVPPGRRPARVVSFGQLGKAKGVDLLQGLMQRNHDAGSPFEFHFLGPEHPTFEPARYGGISHGPYDRANIQQLLAEIAPSYAVVASVWPETYCHTLTEAWLGGLPVFASDLGTLRERILAHGGGWLVPPGDPDAWFEQMSAVTADAAQWWARRAEVRAMRLPTIDTMARSYRELYGELLPVAV
jgi:GT2 family glycosyltransferase/glycosyltransferase involved in cell wall biosynthesis